MTPFCYHSFDLRQLVSFAEIARTGSFRQAAKTLHIAQPALSRQIKQLEAALGIYLFDRAPRRLHLTIEGRELAGRLPVHRLIRPTPMLDCYLVYRKNPSSPLLKSFVSICLPLGRDFR
jgi:Bacterial regulatory helix-turn-helix protein, lysR family